MFPPLDVCILPKVGGRPGEASRGEFVADTQRGDWSRAILINSREEPVSHEEDKVTEVDMCVCVCVGNVPKAIYVVVSLCSVMPQISILRQNTNIT